MADKFLGTGGGAINLSNGTANIYAGTLGAAGLDPSQPVKTNSLRQLISSKLAISDINNLTGILDNVLTNPFNGTFQVNDLETADTFSLNSELQKIDNFTASSATDTNITGNIALTGALKTSLIQSEASLSTNVILTEFNAEVNGDSALYLRANDEAFFISGGFIEIESSASSIIIDNDIQISSTDLKINNKSVVSELGGKNLDTTLTTTQTSFTLDQELITKKYVDDNAGSDVKTQNISASETDSTKTTFNNYIAVDNIYTKGNVVEDMVNATPFGKLDSATYVQNVGINSVGGKVEYLDFNINNGATIECDFNFPDLSTNPVYRILLGKQQNTSQNSYMLDYRPNSSGSNLSLYAFVGGGSSIPYNAIVGNSITKLKIIYSKTNIIIEANDVEVINGVLTDYLIKPSVAFAIGSFTSEINWTNIKLTNDSNYIQVANVDYVDDKFINTIFDTPPLGTVYDLNFAATDEVNLITTTGQKIQINIPRNFNVKAIKLGCNTAGGTGFEIALLINGNNYQTITQNSLLISTLLVDNFFNVDDILSLVINNVGSGTASGLKCYLTGVVS
mgnify:FL=1